jgi:AcrR family transcriptional regulator
VKDGEGHNSGQVPQAAVEAIGLRERKKRQTRRALEEVAVELFVERGFDGVTIDEIVAAANVSKRTFYRYYDAKEDVLLSEHLQLLDTLCAALVARPPDEPLFDALRNALRHLGDENCPDMALIFDKTRLLWETPSLAARMMQHQLTWEHALAGTIALRLGIDDPSDLRPPVLAAAILAALRVISQRWIESAGGMNLTELVERHLIDLGRSVTDL